MKEVMKDVISGGSGVCVQKHSIAQSIALHLLPGLLFLPVFLIAAQLTDGLNIPKHLAPSLIGFTLVIIPFESGFLLYQGKKLNGRFSLKGVILYRESIR